MIISEELELEITAIKKIMLSLLISGNKSRRIDRNILIGDMLSSILDEEDFEGGQSTSCNAVDLINELSDLLSLDDDCESFLNRLKELLIEREKYEILHFLEL